MLLTRTPRSPSTQTAMQAVLLAAGVGRRLRPLTNDRPKCLVPVADVPLVDRLIGQLYACGVRRFVVATGYRSGQLRRHVLARWADADVELRFVDNPDHATTNNLVTLSRCHDAVDADLLIVETDLVLGPTVVARMVGRGSAALISPYAEEMDGTSVAFDPTRGITHMYVGGEGAPERGGFKTVNLTRLSNADWTNAIVPGLQACRANGDHHRYYEHVIAGALSAGHMTLDGVVISTDAWAEVDTPDDLCRAEALVASRNRTGARSYQPANPSGSPPAAAT